ncbi:MAG: zf-HC2 domain-containing protein [Gammaproteobacteria bacterium]|nr:zf-HC2 domain-containing protein [Gammaproteobacteria bacterium]
MTETCSHSDAWLLLPWLANGRLGGAERVRVEEHVRGCTQCIREVALQRRLCEVLTEPERVTYAPGPSFRKLMDRIDGRAPMIPAQPPAARPRAPISTRGSAWRPPGLAWAASFLLVVGFAGLATTGYQWSQKQYHTHTSAPAPGSAAVLHIAFAPSLSITEVGEALRSAGARVVEGPDSAGIVGVVPAAGSTSSPDAGADLRALAARLRTDGRVRWVQPLAAGAATEPRGGPPQP